MKLSPFALFLLLLFVLALVILVGNWVQSDYSSPSSNPFGSVFHSSPFEYYTGKTTEGMLSFYADVSYGSVKIPNYTMTRNVNKLHDCVYYDPSNGTVILLDGNTYIPGGEYDRFGNTLTSMSLVERDSKKSAPITTVLSVSGDYQSDVSKKPMRDFYNSFTVTSNVTLVGGTPDKYELIYVSWGKETYLHLITLNNASDATKNNQLRYTFVFDSSGKVVQTVNQDAYSNESNIAVHDAPLPKIPPPSHDQYDGTRQSVLGYDTGNTKYQLCKNNYYDTLNGDIIQRDTSIRTNSTINIYSRIVNKNNDPSFNTYVYGSDNRYSPSLPTPTDNVVNVSTGFRAAVIGGSLSRPPKDDDFYYSIVYVSVGQRTVLTVLNRNNSGEYEIRKVFRIQNKQIDDGTVSGSTNVGSSSGGSSDKKTDNKEMDDLLYQYILKTMFSGYDGATINDYMLKTQIVPPVCPTCPSCPSSGVCNNCGGNGGSGTKVSGDGISGVAKETVGVARDLVGGTVDVAKDAVGGTVDVARDAVGGTVGLARDAVGGTVGLARETAGGTVGLARETVGGTVGLVKDTVGGTVGLAKDAVGGVANAFGRLAPTDVSADSSSSGIYRSAGGGRGTSVTTGSDHSSYFGALPSKGGDYIPVTADFSRFGR
jgi:hypothetical protein